MAERLGKFRQRDELYAELVERATGLFGASLIAIVLYGSWARDELTDRSDLDVLVIVTSDTTVNRDQYRKMGCGSARLEQPKCRTALRSLS